MERYQGKGVYGAVAMGRVSLFRRRELTVRQIQAADVPEQKERATEAMKRSVEQLREICRKTALEAGVESTRIFEAHILMIEDEGFQRFVQETIETGRIDAESAVTKAADRFAAMFSAMEDEYMRERASDVRDIACRIIANLDREKSVPGGLDGQTAEKDTLISCERVTSGNGAQEKIILCAEDLSPSETATLDKDRVLAFVTARGSICSHTAILAGSLNIPAVVGIGGGFLKRARDGMAVIVDGITGEVFLEPDRETWEWYERKREQETEKKRLLREMRGKESRTLDGTRIHIFVNLSTAEGVNAALDNDAEGIGLFRSEFLYLENTDYPTEEQQLAAYRKVLEGMGGKKVIIRTLDIGADKQADYFRLAGEENPALGCRGIRLCLTRPHIFKTQLRALYRASVYGKLGIMFPMITSVWEVERIREICGEVQAELDKEGIEYSKDVELGIMIETPAAALISDKLAPLVDFFSVGTNDLTQYTLACDRQNPQLENFRDTRHEAVLRLIRMSAENAHKHGVWIGICGELAADTSLTETFLRMGIDEFSVSPGRVLEVRKAVRELDLRKGQQLPEQGAMR